LVFYSSTVNVHPYLLACVSSKKKNLHGVGYECDNRFHQDISTILPGEIECSR